MGITLRRYKLLSDFERVNELIRQNFVKYQQNGSITQPYWEYAHVHPCFDHSLTHRFGIWEEDGEIIAVACYEVRIGDCYLITKIGYEHMKPGMVDYAEKELFKVADNAKSLNVMAFDYEIELKEALVEKGYKKEYSQPITVFKYENGFKESPLPEGYTIVSLEDEYDVQKIHEVLWRGFDHGDEPDDDLDCRMLMHSAPNFRKDLTTIIKAPNGDYACFAGMWME